MIVFTLPIRTYSESNQRLHWAVKAQRVKEQRGQAKLLTLVAVRSTGKPLPAQPWRITLTRIGKRRLDTGNNPGAMKAVQDGLCDALGIDDGDEAHDWLYKQRIEKQYAVEVRIESK